MGGDVNAHHTVWGSTDTNSRGEKLLEFIASTSMDIMNRGNSPTFVTKNRSEVLDITLATQNISNRISQWHVSNEDSLSDHREINFYFECSHQIKKNLEIPGTQTGDYLKGNWDHY